MSLSTPSRPDSPSARPSGTGLGLWLFFLVALGLWTWKLLEPSPVPETITDGIPTELKFWLSKALHLSAYAFLTVVARLLPVRRSTTWALVAILALHAIGTEIGQTYVPNRHGTVRDVVIDWVGIGLGLFIYHKVATRRSARR